MFKKFPQIKVKPFAFSRGSRIKKIAITVCMALRQIWISIFFIYWRAAPVISPWLGTLYCIQLSFININNYQVKIFLQSFYSQSAEPAGTYDPYGFHGWYYSIVQEILSRVNILDICRNIPITRYRQITLHPRDGYCYKF